MKRFDVHITESGCWMEGAPLPTQAKGDELISELYRTYVGDYPKFYKMDGLCKLAFVASELVLQRESQQKEQPRFVANEKRKVILANRSASLKNDTDYLQTITENDYYPSPALFVYTLPNITTGEIAIRNKFFGETCFFVAENEQQWEDLLASMPLEDALVGWVEYKEKGKFDCTMWLQS